MNPSHGSGMILLIDKSNGVPIGHVAAVVNSNQTGWISMFIIDAPHRGKGLGRVLFQAGLDDAEKAGVKILGLDAVREQKATCTYAMRLYLKSADDTPFLSDERRRFIESPLGTVKILVRELASKEFLSTHDKAEADGELVNILRVPEKLLVEHELHLTGFERPKLWTGEHILDRPDVGGFALVTSGPPVSAGYIKAWVMTRRCSGGVRIGPLYAEDATSAKTVLIAAMKSATAKLVKDTPLPNEPISELSEAEIHEKATLVTEIWGGNPDADKVFGELGWKPVGVEYHRMWVDGKAIPEWSEGGAAQKGVFAVFDAAVG